MNHEVYLLGGNIKNHIWKFVCLLDDNGDLCDNEYFKFIDETNERYYGLWGKGYSKKGKHIKIGGENKKIEEEIRKNKSKLDWIEPSMQYRWDSETGKKAIMKRWIGNKKEKYKIKKMKLCGDEMKNGKKWRLILKIRSDGNKLYDYFEF